MSEFECRYLFDEKHINTNITGVFDKITIKAAKNIDFKNYKPILNKEYKDKSYAQELTLYFKI